MAIQLENIRILPGGETSEPDPREEQLFVVEQAAGGAAEAVGSYKRIEAAPPHTPSEFLVGSVAHPRYRLTRPLRVRVEREGDFVTVWAEDLEELGYGEYLTAAVEDLQHTIVELYLTLRAEQTRLGPDMARLWERLQQLIEERT